VGDNPLKIHVGPDGSFSAFNIADECIAEGKGVEDLNRLLVAKAALVWDAAVA
jgi:hypothetical protein